MSSLDKIIDQWKTGKPVEHASITSWLEKPKGVGSNFAKNLRADCA